MFLISRFFSYIETSYVLINKYVLVNGKIFLISRLFLKLRFLISIFYCIVLMFEKKRKGDDAPSTKMMAI